MELPLEKIPSPAYVVDLEKLEANARLLAEVQERAGCKVLLALKGFAMHATFPLLRKYLAGTTASGIHEALLGHEHFGGEVHVFSPAYTEPEMARLLRIAGHLIFNSPGQWAKYRDTVRTAPRAIECALRLNPEHSTVAVPLYDPCAPGSRLGTTLARLEAALAETPDLLDGLTGLHFHTLCEQNADALEATLAAVEEKFGKYIAKMRWMNFGGGHHITRPDYDLERLVHIVQDFRKRWPNIETVYLEPGEAVALNTGYLVCTVLDVLENDGKLAILDTSATAHMPDVLEMPYRPQIVGAGEPGEKACDVRLGGLTCLAGDVIGTYSFERPLAPGDRLVFTDMAHYTMVKNTTFNGVPLPSLCTWDPRTGDLRTVRRFGYEDYRARLS